MCGALSSSGSICQLSTNAKFAQPSGEALVTGPSGNRASTRLRSSRLIMANRNLLTRASLTGPQTASAPCTRLACNWSSLAARTAPLSVTLRSRSRRSSVPVCWPIQPSSTSFFRTRARLCFVIFSISSRSATRSPGLRLTKWRTRWWARPRPNSARASSASRVKSR